MARAPQVEFPGKKRQKVRCEAQSTLIKILKQKIKRSLARLLDDPQSTVPKMIGSFLED